MLILQRSAGITSLEGSSWEFSKSMEVSQWVIFYPHLRPPSEGLKKLRISCRCKWDAHSCMGGSSTCLKMKNFKDKWKIEVFHTKCTVALHQVIARLLNSKSKDLILVLVYLKTFSVLLWFSLWSNFQFNSILMRHTQHNIRS